MPFTTPIGIALDDWRIRMPLKQKSKPSQRMKRAVPRAASTAMPMLLGQAVNISAFCSAPETLIYQIDAQSVCTVDGVYDRGIPLEFKGDVTSIQKLKMAELSPGQFKTCVAAGAFRLGGTPAGEVTVDARGADNPKIKIQSVGDLAGAAGPRIQKLRGLGLLFRDFDGTEPYRGGTDKRTSDHIDILVAVSFLALVGAAIYFA